MSLQKAPWRAQDKPMASTLRQVEAARRIRDGELIVPFRCARCKSPSVELVHPEGERQDPTPLRSDCLHCLQCGTYTTVATAKHLRVAEIKETIARGVDL